MPMKGRFGTAQSRLLLASALLAANYLVPQRMSASQGCMTCVWCSSGSQYLCCGDASSGGWSSCFPHTSAGHCDVWHACS